MPVSVEYVARETGANLWRNRLMTIAAILTVTVSLSLVGAALLLRQGAAKAEVDWQRGTEVTVWMQPDASQSEIAAVRTQLAALSYIDQPATFRDQQQNYEQAKSLLTSDEFAVLSPRLMPTSFWATPVQPQDAKEVIARFSGQPGVRNVTAPLAQIHSEEEAITVIQIAFFVIALVLLVSAAVLILNTIRMAIFARRREVSVMKLVGATNWFIRVPFMCEGVVQGLAGALFAAMAVFGLHFVLDSFSNTSTGNIWYQMQMPVSEVVVTSLVVVSIGVIIGSVGSALGIRRFLDT